MSVSTRQGSLWFGAAGATALLLVLLFNLPVASELVTTPTTTNAMHVQLDPETGEMVPVSGLDKAELGRQMEKRLNRSTVGLVKVHHADGSVSMNLDGRFQSLSVATADSTGHIRTGCLTSRQELEQWLEQDPSQQDKE